MNANDALLLSTLGVSAIFALFAYLIVLRITAQPGAVGGAGGGIPGTGGLPPVAIKPRFTGITATSFGGSNDRNASAYGGTVDGDSPGVALPARISGTRPRVRVFYNGKTCDCDIVDLGPWNINDPYWTSNSRPQAESGTDNTGRKTNLAGIDLTPGAWSALGVSNPDSVKTKVDWDFVNVLDASTGPTPSPVSGAPWITLGQIYVDNLRWDSGPMPMQITAWLNTIVSKFPEEAAYVNALKAAGAHDWFAWCGVFVRSMLAPYGVKGPISAAGLRGETTTADWAYVDAWLDWGTKVWGSEDGPISNAKPQVGDVLIWKAPGIHHVSFYGKPLPDTDTFSSLGGDQGHPLRVCEEEIAMSKCVAIRRPPTG